MLFLLIAVIIVVLLWMCAGYSVRLIMADRWWQQGIMPTPVSPIQPVPSRAREALLRTACAQYTSSLSVPIYLALCGTYLIVISFSVPICVDRLTRSAVGSSGAKSGGPCDGKTHGRALKAIGVVNSYSFCTSLFNSLCSGVISLSALPLRTP